MQSAQLVGENDLDNYLFLTTSSKEVTNFSEGFLSFTRLEKHLKNSGDDIFEGLLSVAAIFEIGGFVDKWMPKMQTAIKCHFGDLLPTQISFSKDSLTSKISILDYLMSIDSDRLLKHARGEGLEQNVRKRKTENNGEWSWNEDIEFLKFHLIRRPGLDFQNRLSVEDYKIGDQVIDSLRDLLPERY